MGLGPWLLEWSAGGMGSCRGLASGTLRCLVAWLLMPGVSALGVLHPHEVPDCGTSGQLPGVRRR